MKYLNNNINNFFMTKTYKKAPPKLKHQKMQKKKHSRAL